MRELLRRIHYLLNRRRFDRELAEEMEAHRAMAGGRPLGNELRLREEAREAWGWTWLDRLGQDLRFAGRQLRRSPGFTAAAVLMLALGIGVNVAAFGFFDLLVLRPLPVKEPATLVRFMRSSPRQYASTALYAEYRWVRERSRTMAGWLAMNLSKVSVEGDAQPAEAAFVSANWFAELGAAPVLGRLLSEGADQDGPAAVVLSHSYWRRQFGGGLDVVGRTVRVNGQPVVVVGVASADFVGLRMKEPALWAVLERQPELVAGSTLLEEKSEAGAGVLLWGRLAAGSTMKGAEDEMRALLRRLRAEQPEMVWEDETLAAQAGGYATGLMSTGQRGSGSGPKQELYPVLGLVSVLTLLILVVACANLGSLLLARSVARAREMSIRAAVGAGRGRLVRQLLTESLVLAGLGAAAGLGAGLLVLRELLRMTGGPAWMQARPDWRVAVFAAGMAGLATLLFGLAPAFQIVRQKHKAGLARHVLVGAQVAASALLLVVSGLLVRALDHATTADPGFDYHNVVAVNPGLAGHGFTAGRAEAYLAALEGRLRALPGVTQVGRTLSPPLGQVTITSGFTVEGRRVAPQMNFITPELLETMRIPVVAGRRLVAGEKNVVLVSETLAAKAWPGRSALGERLGEMTVVGVTRAARTVHVEDSDAIEAYVPLSAEQQPGAWLVVRTAGPAPELPKQARAEVQALDAALFGEVLVLESRFKNKVETAESMALVVGLFGVLAQVLAALGLFGVVAYAVSQRTKEIGIRVALGARRGRVVRVVLRQFAAPVGIGLVLGVVAAGALAQFLRGYLFGLSHLDPWSYGGAVAVFAGTVALAVLEPARRILKVDPLVALRHE